MHAVPDPNVLVSAIVTPGGTCATLLARLVTSELVIVVSPLLLEELERVLALDTFSRLGTRQRAAYLEFVRRISRVVDDPTDEGAELATSDPGDAYLLRLALADERRLVVTGDGHLLELAGTYPVVSPRELLDRLERRPV